VSDLGLLLLRVVSGGLLAGHGAQKLFGWFGGAGPRGTARFIESMGIRPAGVWALAAGSSELAGGTLTALGLLWPLGPVTATAPMGMAVGRVHWGRPIWATEGGGELPVTNLAISAALAMTGPGRLSLDHLLRLRLPRWLAVLSAAGVTAGLALALRGGWIWQESVRRAPAPEAAETAPHAGRPAVVTPELGAGS
jgi:putative oxidoreductase